MSRTYSLDAALGHSTATRLMFTADTRVPKPSARAATNESATALTDQLDARDAPAVSRFLNGGDPLPFDVLSRLRDTFTKEQLAGLLGVHNREPKMNDVQPAEPVTDPEPPQILRVSDAVWAKAKALLDELDPARPSGVARRDRRPILNAVVNRALYGTFWGHMREFGIGTTFTTTVKAWFARGAFLPLVDLLTNMCPELTGADWGRALTAEDAAKFAAGKVPEKPAAKGPKAKAVERATETARRVGRRNESADLADRFNIKVKPTPMGSVTLGDLTIELLYDPRAVGEGSPARHCYVDGHSITFVPNAGVGDIGRAITNHLQVALNRKVEGRRKAAN